MRAGKRERNGRRESEGRRIVVEGGVDEGLLVGGY